MHLTPKWEPEQQADGPAGTHEREWLYLSSGSLLRVLSLGEGRKGRPRVGVMLKICSNPHGN